MRTPFPAPLARTLTMVSCLLAVGGSPCRSACAQDPPIDMTSLGQGPGSAMSALLEKTIFKVDVLRLDLRLGPETQRELVAIIRGRAYSDELAGRIAVAALRTRDAWAAITFSRHVSLGRFVDGVDASLRCALAAGIITDANYHTVRQGLPRWFGFLEARGFQAGDQILYRITAAGLRTVFRSVEGQVLLDQIDQGSDPPLALLGGYFAPGSDFRALLIKSLF
jgi:hypothetical protein